MACTAKRTNLKNLLIKKQSADVFDQPASTDDYRLNAGFVAQLTPEVVARDILKSSYTPEADLVALKIGTMTGVSEMYGDDYTDGTTKPYFNDVLESVQLTPAKLEAIPVSAIATQFVHNEIVSGATGVGRVVVPTIAGDTVVVVAVTTPGFTAETITGSISGSATATGVEADHGWSYKFNSNLCERLSCQAEEDGLISKIYNAVPTLTITADDSGIPLLNYEISGVIYEDTGIPQWLRDGSMSTIVRDETVPPLFQSGRLSYVNQSVSFVPVVDSTNTTDLAINRPARRDANNAGGVEGFVVTGRAPTQTIRIDTPTNADADFTLDWLNSDSVALEWRYGQEQGNTFWFFAPTSKIENATPTDQDGFMKQELQFKLTGQDDEELEIVCI